MICLLRTSQFRFTLSIVLALGLSSFLRGQSVELYFGQSIHYLYTPSKFIEPYDYTNTQLGVNYSAGIGFDSIPIFKHNFRFSLSYDKFENQIFSISSDSRGSIRTDARLRKEVLNLSIYPFNYYKLLKGMQVSLGFSTSVLVKHINTGMVDRWVDGTKISSSLQEEYPKINPLFDLGAVALLSYELPIRSRWYLVPRLEFYYGIGNEFQDFPRPVRSVRLFRYVSLRAKL